jgi:uncharacterized protein (DUF1684 family)
MKNGGKMEEEKAYNNEIIEQRKGKDWFFKNHEHSPLYQSQKKTFSGLSYYPIDSKLRFILPLKEHDEKQTIRVEDSKGGIQTYMRWGEFSFNINGETYTLQAYKNHPSDNNLWVPFKDETNNKETYGAGRYIDLTEGTDTIDDQYILDFNLAYNPFCAYNKDYVCPFIPPENWLKIPITAGEKAFIEQLENYPNAEQS